MTGSALTVTEVVRDVQFVFRTNRHQLKTFGPTLDDTIERELDGFATLVTAIEDRTIDERSFIVYLDGLLCGRFWTFTFYQYFVLQTGLGYFDFVAESVLLQELLAFCFGSAIFLFCNNAFHILTCRLHIHLLGVVVQTVDEALFNKVVVGLETLDAQQAYGFLFTNGTTDRLSGINQLRVADILLHTNDDILDELFGVFTRRVFCQEI